jgi:hypothetical protein
MKEKNKTSRAWYANDHKNMNDRPLGPLPGDREEIKWEDLSEFEGCQVIPGLEDEIKRIFADISAKNRGRKA